jgi:hypothetical protein
MAQMSQCHAPFDCTKIPISRDNLIAIAKACGITSISRKNMLQLCSEIQQISQHGGRQNDAASHSDAELQQILKLVQQNLQRMNININTVRAPLIPPDPRVSLPSEVRAGAIHADSPMRGARSTKTAHGCVDLSGTYPKYRNRDSPPYPANECCGEIKTGNDNKLYHSTRNINGICTWKLYRDHRVIRK